MTLSDTGKTAALDARSDGNRRHREADRADADPRVAEHHVREAAVAANRRDRALSHPVERRDRDGDERRSDVDVHERVHAQSELPVEEHSRPRGHRRGALRVHEGLRVPAKTWNTLGATVTIAGVGFWNPVKTTLGALGNGAELGPSRASACSRGAGSSERAGEDVEQPLDVLPVV